MEQTIASTGRRFVHIYLSADLIGDTDFMDWRLHVQDEKELKGLPFSANLKAMHRRELKKAKFGIAIDPVGGVLAIKKKGQIVADKVECLKRMGFRV